MEQILSEMRAGRLLPSALLKCTLEHPDYAVGSVFTQIYPESAMRQAQDADESLLNWRAKQDEAKTWPPISKPLMGLPVSVKDLLDVQGSPTWAGSPTRLGIPPAQQDAPIVAKLRQAGAVLIGKTNMTELAFSGVGINPAFGTPANPVTKRLGDTVARIPGGSSSGAAVSVAAGLCVATLGSDTGGSLRIPAALCGLVGFKATQSRMNQAGSVALAPSFDTLGAITRTVGDAVLLDRVMADTPLSDRSLADLKGLNEVRLLLPSNFVMEGIEESVAREFEAAVHTLKRNGLQFVSKEMTLLEEIAQRNPAPGISALEAYALHGIAAHNKENGMDTRVRQRILQAAEAENGRLEALLRSRQEWIKRMQEVYFSSDSVGFDALVMPTTVIAAPAIEDLVKSEDAFFKVNALLLRNTFIANYLDGCAISIPCQRKGQAPLGLMLIAPAMRDAQILRIAQLIEVCLNT
jgi:Asp-tRNA(Asn)/Glu-tRNA(Gln) amidotransferase A subunit family amidase